MNWTGHVDQLLELDQPVVSRLFNPVQPKVLDELLQRVPAFGHAFMEKGLKVEEYEEYGPVMYFRDSFVSAWKNVIDLVKQRRCELS